MRLPCSSEIHLHPLAPVLVRRTLHALHRCRPDYKVFAVQAPKAQLSFSGPSLELGLPYRVRPNFERPPSSTPLRMSLGSPARWNPTTPPLRFPPLQRFPHSKQRLCVEQAYRTCSPAPSGFHNLLTPSSAPSLLTLFHVRSALGVSPFRALLLPCSRTPSPMPIPSCRSVHRASHTAYLPPRRSIRRSAPACWIR